MWHRVIWSGDHSGAIHACARLDFGQLIDRRDQIAERDLGILAQVAALGHLALEVDPQGGTLAAGAGEAQHHPAAVVEQQAQALAIGKRAVYRVGVSEVVGGGDGAAGEALTHQAGLHVFDPVVETMGGVAGDRLIVVAGVVVWAEMAPVLRHDPAHRLPPPGQDLQPEQHRPEAVLLADLVAAGAEALLAAEGDATGIEHVAKEFPTRRRFEAGDAQLLGHHIGAVVVRHAGIEEEHLRRCANKVKWNELEAHQAAPG